MSELREWLRRHNLEQYADAFEANDIGIDILPELSERDLEQLGLSLGNRRRLLKAVAGRAAEAASPPQELPAQARGRGRASPGHGAVLRHGRFDGAVERDRSRTPWRRDPALSGCRRRRDRPLRRFRRQVHGRRGPGLFRLSARLRGCRGTRRSRSDQHPRRSRRHRAAGRFTGAGPDRDRDRSGRGRRDRRLRHRAGAHHRRRHA